MPRSTPRQGGRFGEQKAELPPYRKPDIYFVRRDPTWCAKTGKYRYGSKVEAMMTLRELEAKKTHGQPGRGESRAYECDHCTDRDGRKGWHFTSDRR
jgi:hypothetical protein